MKLLIVCAFSFVFGMIAGAIIAFKAEDENGREIVHCKSCDFSERTEAGRYFCKKNLTYFNADEFCSRGK